MRNNRSLGALSVVFVTAWLLAATAGVDAQSAPGRMEWLSWSHFRFTSPGGKVLRTNPFVTNPDSPIKAADITKADIIVVADGHRDEVGSTDEIAIKTGARVLAASEISTENPNLKTVIPHHHRLQPPAGAPTAADLENAIKAAGLPVQVLNPELSRTYELVK